MFEPARLSDQAAGARSQAASSTFGHHSSAVSCHACVRFVERCLDGDLVASLRRKFKDDWRVLRVLEKHYPVELAAFRKNLRATLGKLSSRPGVDRLPLRFIVISGTARIRVVENVAVTTLSRHERDARARRRRPRLDAGARERLRAERDRRFGSIPV